MASDLTESPKSKARRSLQKPIGDDPVTDNVREWLDLKTAQETLVREWQGAEHALSIRSRSVGLGLDQAMTSDLPEARSMRSLMRRIKAADRRLETTAAEIIRLKACSVLGALSKIEMALRLQQACNCGGLARAALEAGADDLRRLQVQAARQAPP